jgi:serine/threonine protein kinase/WD40 repeat protein
MGLAAGTRLGPYEILAPLGAGGMGEVYKARDARLGRDVALKILPARFSSSPEARARFEREARAISQLSDPHICTLYDIGRQDDIDYLVMEYLEGQTLAARLEKGPLPIAEVLRYGIEIAQALDRAHRSGIVHRDLKPANILLTGGARQSPAHVKLMNFGLARAVETGPAGAVAMESPTISHPLTAEGTIVGTLPYMAPEQLAGKEADARTDLWALGCVLYEMATGTRAFQADSQASLVAAIMDREPPEMATLRPLSPPALEHVVKRCLTKDPGERWQSARDVAHALEWVTQQGAAVPVTAPDTRRSRKRPSVLSGAAVALVVVALAVAVFLAGRLTVDRPKPLTFTRLTLQRGVITNARFKPNARDVVYSTAWEGRPPEIFETETQTANEHPLPVSGVTSGVALLSVAAGGELALRKQAESFVPADGMLAVGSLSGSAPRDRYPDVHSADWAAGGVLAIVRRVGGHDRLEMPADHVLAKTSGQFFDVRVSPDGRHIALTEHPSVADSKGTVALVNTATGEKKTLTNGFRSVWGLVWSPDGREVWFSAAVDGPRQRLWAVTPEGRMRSLGEFPSSVILYDVARDGRVLLASQRQQAGIRGRSSTDEKERELGWRDAPGRVGLSADGGTVLFDDQGESGGPRYTVYVRPHGSAPVALGEGHACALSPDGRWALAIRLGPPDELVMISTGTEGTTPLPRGQLETHQSATFLSERRVVFVGAEHGRPQRTWVQDIPSGQPRAVTEEGTVGVTTSPDGRSVATVAEDLRLMIFPIDGGKPRLLPRLDPKETVCQWSQDDTTLYVSRLGTRLDVFALDLRSGTKELWRTFELPDPAGGLVWNVALTRDARSYAYGYGRALDELFVVEGLK